jgi:hypothetical protein
MEIDSRISGKASRAICRVVGRHDKLSPWYGEDRTSKYDRTPLSLVRGKGLKKGCCRAPVDPATPSAFAESASSDPKFGLNDITRPSMRALQALRASPS